MPHKITEQIDIYVYMIYMIRRFLTRYWTKAQKYKKAYAGYTVTEMVRFPYEAIVTYALWIIGYNDQSQWQMSEVSIDINPRCHVNHFFVLE